MFENYIQPGSVVNRTVRADGVITVEVLFPVEVGRPTFLSYFSRFWLHLQKKYYV